MKFKALANSIITALFIFLFTYTALSKFLDFASFKNVLHNSPLIGSLSVFIAWALPIAELLVAAGLFFPRTKLIGMWSSLLLMTVFTIYITYMILFTPHLPCSCGGVLRQLSWRQHLWFNLFFTALAVISIGLTKQNTSPGVKNIIAIIRGSRKPVNRVGA
jgi:putative oxidoreductase